MESALVSHPAVAEAAAISSIARPDSVTFVDSLPKTRSGKIMRRLLKAPALGVPEGDISTLEE